METDTSVELMERMREISDVTHWNAIGVFLADALSFCLALLEWVLVLELGSHDGGLVERWSG